MKKNVNKLIMFVLILVMSLTFVACVPNEPDPDPEAGKIKITPLADLTDYGSVASYYNVTKIVYDNAVRQEEVAKLKAKIEDREGYDPKDPDTETITKIFYNSDEEKIMESFEISALPQAKMVKLVAYLTKPDVAKDAPDADKGAIQDYNELQDLQDAYDAEETDANNDALQLKRYDIQKKVINIFQEEGDQFARTLTNSIIYGQLVVDDMYADYLAQTGDYVGSTKDERIIDLDTFYKYELKDYETLVYMKSFNETIGGKNGAEFRDIVRLYGYYYLYEKKNNDTLTRTQLERQLTLSHKVTMTNPEALEYNTLNRKVYSEAYRYTSDFYKKYYEAHFTFQAKQEKYDKTVYTGGAYPNGIGDAQDGQSTTYSGEMLAGLNVGMEAQLKISDVNYDYTGKEVNVTNYNTANSNWNGLTDDQQRMTANKIKEVRLNVENLKSQHYTLTHPTMKTSDGRTANNDFSNALKYQIKSYSGDYIRNIQSNKKANITLNDELYVLKRDNAEASVITAKEIEIGRNSAILLQLNQNYSSAGISTQFNTAASAAWTIIADEINITIKLDYSKIPGDEVQKKFEDTLIKKTYDCGFVVGDVPHTDATCKNSPASTCSTKEQKYDGDHKISRLMDSHETVFRYMYGQVTFQFKAKPNATTARVDGVGVWYEPKDCKTRPTPSSYVAKKITQDASEIITGKPTSTEMRLADVIINEAGTNSDGRFNYSFTFRDWYLDAECKYELRADDKFDFDMAFYPGYRVRKVAQA